MGYMDKIYDQLNQTFGGNNPNQLFCMMMPGTVLDPGSYAWNPDAEKPAWVAEKESELVNQMFDIAQITGSGNGRKLPDSYLTALGSLVPKFDKELAKVKARLRDVLNSKPDYTFEDGTKFQGTFEELYFILFQGWIDARRKWDDEQQAERDRLARLHPNDPKKLEDEFLRWYETVAEGRLAEMEARMGKVLALFSPEDINAIFGALEAGVGGRLEEARRQVTDVRRPNPNGGYVYPVELRPADWFLDLTSDTDPIDLLQDPAYIALKIDARRSALQATMAQVQGLLARQTTDAQINSLRESSEKAQSDLDSAQSKLLSTYTDNIVTAVKIYLAAETGGASSALADVLGGKSSDEKTGIGSELSEIADSVEEEKSGKEVEAGSKTAAITPEQLDDLAQGQKQLIDAQTGYVASAQKVSDAAQKLAQAESSQLTSLPVLASRIKAMLADVENLENQLVASTRKFGAVKPQTTSTDLAAAQSALSAAQGDVDAKKQAYDAAVAAEKADDTPSNKRQVTNARKALDEAQAALTKAQQDVELSRTASAPPALSGDNAPDGSSRPSKVANRFMNLTTYFTLSEISDNTSNKSQSSETSWSVNLFFGSASGNKSQSSSNTSTDDFESDTAIEIGMSATKVEIDRPWFDPEVFLLTKDMMRLTQNEVSSGRPMTVTDGVATFAPDQAETANDALFPCYPTAFVVAKDITIKFKTNSSRTRAVKNVADSHSAVGGGFLCFSASHSSTSHSDDESLNATTLGQVVTIRIPAPQILGWFLEFVPEDKSKQMTETDDQSIIAYVDELMREITKNNGSAQAQLAAVPTQQPNGVMVG